MSSPASNDAIGETTSAFYLRYRRAPPSRASPDLMITPGAVAHRCTAGRSSQVPAVADPRRLLIRGQNSAGHRARVVVHDDRAAPAPSREFAGDGDRADRGPLGTYVQAHPPPAQSAVAQLCPFPNHGWLPRAAADHFTAGPIWLAVIPG